MTYELQYKTNLTDATWRAIGKVTPTTNTASKTDNAPANTTNHFYRVELLR